MENQQQIDPFDGLDELPAPPTGKKTKQPKKSTMKAVKDIAPPTPEAEADHQTKAQLIYAIQSYGKNKRLGPYLANDCGHRFDDKYLSSLSLDNLKLELEKQEVALGSKQNSGLVDQGIKQGLTFAESMIDRTSRFKVKGTTETLYNDDHYLDLLERVKMKYTMPFVKLDPVMELALVIGQTAMITHHANSYRQNLQPTANLDEDVQFDE